MPPIRKGDGTPVTPKGISQIRTGDGRILFDGPAIPDSDVYLHDDFDGGETDREDAVTFTYNGEEAFYRPEWSQEGGSGDITGWDGSVNVGSITVYAADINLNLSETVRWYWDVESLGGRLAMGLFAETSNAYIDAYAKLENGYFVMDSGGDIRIIKHDTDGSRTDLITDDSTFSGSRFYGVERDSEANWELFATDETLENPKSDLFDSDYSVGAASDDTYDSPAYIWMGDYDGDGGAEINEVKSF